MKSCKPPKPKAHRMHSTSPSSSRSTAEIEDGWWTDDSASSIKVQPPISCRKPLIFADIPNKACYIKVDPTLLPPLPLIKCPQTRRQAGTSRQSLMKSGLSLDEAELASYEYLETLGDSVLSLRVLEFVKEEWPRMTSNIAVRIKTYLVSNITLADISKGYKLTERGLLVSGQKGDTKVQADLFEAYVGALHRQKTPEETESFLAWLRTIFMECFPDLDQLVNTLKALSPFAKMNLPRVKKAKARGIRSVSAIRDLQDQLRAARKKLDAAKKRSSKAVVGEVIDATGISDSEEESI